MSCVVAAASELIAPECALIVAARIAATINPRKPGGIESTTNVGKIESGTAKWRPPIEHEQPDSDHQEQRELREDGDPAADECLARFLEAATRRAGAAR